jgi:hypothetical protein
MAVSATGYTGGLGDSPIAGDPTHRGGRLAQLRRLVYVTQESLSERSGVSVDVMRTSGAPSAMLAAPGFVGVGL